MCRLSTSSPVRGLPGWHAQVAAQISTFLAAGYETTASALAFTVYNVAAHPAAEARLLKEVDAFGRNTVPTYDHLDKVTPGDCFAVLRADGVSQTTRARLTVKTKSKGQHDSFKGAGRLLLAPKPAVVWVEHLLHLKMSPPSIACSRGHMLWQPQARLDTWHGACCTCWHDPVRWNLFAAQRSGLAAASTFP